jgi:uncharacterized protein
LQQCTFSNEGSMFYGYFIEPNIFEVNRYDVSSLFNLKQGDISFLQISDLHIDSYGNFEKRIAKEISKLSPDFILFTGDMIESNTQLKALEMFLSLLPYKIKKYAILGNCLRLGIANPTRLMKIYRKNNCQFLFNSSAIFKKNSEEIQIIGLAPITRYPSVKKAIRLLNGIKENHILIIHEPSYRDKIIENGYKIKLMLAGHTHGGQIFLLKRLFFHRGNSSYTNGWYKDRYPFMYVSKGIGTSYIPIRIGVIPEITVFEINSQ